MDTQDMIQHPEKYGFIWNYGPVNKGKGDRAITVCERGPLIQYTDLDLAGKTFGPTHFLDMANGTSGRVRDQRVVRDACVDDIGIRKDDLKLKQLVIQAALGQRTGGRQTVIVEKTVEKRIYVASDGQEFTEKAELMAHEVDLKLAAQEDQDNE